MARQFEYYRYEFEGYLGNVGYYDFRGRWVMLIVTRSGKSLCKAVASRAFHLIRQKTNG